MSEPFVPEEWPPLHGSQDRPGWAARLLAPRVTRRPLTVPLTLTGLGALAFVLSMTLAWQVVTIRPAPRTNPDEDGSSDSVTQTVASTIGSIDTFGLVYLFGVIALLAAAAALCARADLAARFRWAVGGGVVGMLGLLVAITVRIPKSIWPLERTYGIFFAGLDDPITDRSTISYGPGIFAAYFAVLLPAAAIWVASRREDYPAAVPAIPATTPGLAAYAPEPQAQNPNGGAPAGPDDPYRGYRPPAQAGPRDLTVTPD